MRALLVLAAAAGASAAAAPPAAAPVAEIARLDVPAEHEPQAVHVQAREFAPGSESGWHVHPGVEIAYLASGEMELVTAGGVRRLTAGDSFVVPRGQAHNGVNVGGGTARVVITLVVDRDSPLRTSVPAPEAPR